MPIFSDFNLPFVGNLSEIPVRSYVQENKQKITLGLSGVFLIGLVIYLVMKNRGR